MIVKFSLADDYARDRIERLRTSYNAWIAECNENNDIHQERFDLMKISHNQLNEQVADLAENSAGLVQTVAYQAAAIKKLEENSQKLPGGDNIFREQFANQLNNNDKELARLNAEVRDLSLGKPSGAGKALQNRIDVHQNIINEHRVDIDRLTKNLGEVREAIATAGLGVVKDAEAVMSRLDTIIDQMDHDRLNVNEFNTRLTSEVRDLKADGGLVSVRMKVALQQDQIGTQALQIEEIEKQCAMQRGMIDVLIAEVKKLKRKTAAPRPKTKKTK